MSNLLKNVTTFVISVFAVHAFVEWQQEQVAKEVKRQLSLNKSE